MAALLVAVPVLATATVHRPFAIVPAAATAVAEVYRATTVPDPALELPKPPPAPEGRAQAAVDAAESTAAASTQLGVAVHDRLTGEIALGARGAEPFYTASLSKLAVAVDVLDRRRLEGLVVEESDLDLIRRALGPSDDAAMSALWSRFDGFGAAARLSARLGLAATTAPADPSQWGEMSVPPADYLRLYDHVLDTLPPEDRDLLVGALAAAPGVARDGFDQAFGLLAPGVAGPGTAVKQGWMCCFPQGYYLHSAGAAGAEQRFVVVLMSRIPRSGGWEAARSELTGVAAAAVQALA